MLMICRRIPAASCFFLFFFLSSSAYLFCFVFSLPSSCGSVWSSTVVEMILNINFNTKRDEESSVRFLPLPKPYFFFLVLRVSG